MERFEDGGHSKAYLDPCILNNQLVQLKDCYEQPAEVVQWWLKKQCPVAMPNVAKTFIFCPISCCFPDAIFTKVFH